MLCFYSRNVWRCFVNLLTLSSTSYLVTACKSFFQMTWSPHVLHFYSRLSKFTKRIGCNLNKMKASTLSMLLFGIMAEGFSPAVGQGMAGEMIPDEQEIHDIINLVKARDGDRPIPSEKFQHDPNSLSDALPARDAVAPLAEKILAGNAFSLRHILFKHFLVFVRKQLWGNGKALSTPTFTSLQELEPIRAKRLARDDVKTRVTVRLGQFHQKPPSGFILELITK
ncbi:hypothetical protein TGARI_281600 [Toxoplasma gondii ARI]|uniref:Uncharacterized protein n=1 Tax=Toxoplasma gondii ARI TaxID=1074872 RepID=A0A139XYY1_TOXGO|nr:hypothetical protein TGARI_281600 [Toxoplasma gondii ARI]